MKQKLLILLAVLFFAFQAKAQLTLTSNGDGTVNVNYNSADFSLYDPQVDEVVLYIWINTDQNSAASFFADEWTNSASLVTLTWNNVDAHVGIIDFNTHDFTNSGGIIPVNTTITDFNLILRNPAGDRQSANLLATNFGYSSQTLDINENVFSTTPKVFPNPTKNTFSIDLDISQLHIYNISGQLVKTFDGVFNKGEIFDISNLSQNIYFIRIENNSGKQVTIKLVKL